MSNIKINLSETINFVKLLNKFRDIERVIHSNGGDKWENAGSYIFSNDQKRWDENHDEEATRVAYHLGRRVAELATIIKHNHTEIVMK